MNSLIRAVEKLGYEKNDVAVVSGIGCTARMSGYLDFHTLHTLHGRALAFATGVKLGRPSAEGHRPHGRRRRGGHRGQPLHPRRPEEHRPDGHRGHTTGSTA